MIRTTDIKIWIRLTGAIWLMPVIAWSGMALWESHMNRQKAIAQAESFSLSMHETPLAGLRPVVHGFAQVAEPTRAENVEKT
jgi:methyl-accepting chemotaxis protein